MSDLPSKITGPAGDEESPGVVIVDAACRVLDIDEVAAGYLGDGAEAFVGSAVTERFRGLVKENEDLSTIALQRIRRSCTLLRTNGDEIPVDVRIRRFLGGGVQRFALEFAVREPTKPGLNDSFFGAVFDSVDAIAVITDARGVIIYVNERWTRFQRENGGDISTCGIGNDYFSVCSTAQRRDVGAAKAVRDGLEEVLRGARTSFQMSYACDSPTEERWFRVRGNRFSYRDQVYVVILHERVDEFKRVELELRNKQAHLEDAAKLANLGYFERIMRGPRTFDWSPETALMMGRDPQAPAPSIDEYYEIVHPEDRGNLHSGAWTAYGEKRQYETEYRVVLPDGRVRWIHSTARPIFDAGGEIERFFGVLQDVTQTKRIVQELERQEARFRAIFDLSQDGIAVVDADGIIQTANVRFDEIIGFQSGPMVGHSLYEFFTPDSAALIKARFATRMRGIYVDPVVDLVLLDGTRRTLRTSFRQIADARGANAGAIIFATDLTPTVDAQRALELTLARFQRALELTNTLVSDQDRNLRFVRVYNGHFFQDPIGKRDDELLPMEYAKRIVEIKQSVLDSGIPAREDVTVLRSDVLSHFDLCVEPLMGQNGEVVGIMAMAVDITDRVNAEIARQQHNERVRAELEAKNSALESARFEADQANAAKSRFLAMMSHEIRTPLNGVLGMTGVLLDSLQDSAQRDIVETIRISGDALLTIINDILDFSKIEAGLMDLEEQPFALRHCIDDVIDLVGPQARKKFIELAFVVDKRLPLDVFGDITRLRQVLVNLVSNALKFTDSGEVAVEMSMDGVTGAGKFGLHFAVRDTGIGIAAERMGRLFQTFSQVDASINRKYGGTGLGLAICKRLVELMGGKIWVESTQGKGTTFHFSIPTSAAPPIASEFLEAVANARRDLEGKQVLIVDDNATTRYVLGEQLKSFGLVPIGIASAQEAMAILMPAVPKPDGELVNRFLMAIIDLEMPEVTGYQLVNTLRNDPQCAELPMLLTTASDIVPSEVAKRWLAPCLSKPVKPSTLFDGVMRALLHTPHRSSRGPRSIPIDSTLGVRCPLRILLAEDNVINQKVALMLLQRAGYRADVAANGQEVLDAVSTKAYDLILMDVQMPEMDGLEATRRLRGPGPWLGKPRIAAMTADVMREGREACVAAGMDDFVAKPIRVHELMRLLERSAVQRPNEPTSEDAWQAGTEAQLITADEVVIDEGTFAALHSVCALEGDDTLPMLVREFIADSQKMLQSLEVAHAAGDMVTMERLAHTLKGTSGAFGAKTFSRLMADLERAIKERTSTHVVAMIAASHVEHARVASALETLCESVAVVQRPTSVR